MSEATRCVAAAVADPVAEASAQKPGKINTVAVLRFKRRERGAPAPPIARCYFTERTAAPCAPAFAVSSNLTAGLSLSFSKSVGVGGAT